MSEPISKKDQDLNKKLNDNFKEAEEYRSNFENKWNEAQDFYSGRHWPENLKRPFKNQIFRVVETEAPILTDSKPSTDVIPRDPERDDDAKLLDAAKKEVYETQGLLLKDTMAVKSFLKTGTSYQYVDWDSDLENGNGAVTVKNIPWQQVFLDPTANLIEECRYVGFKFPIDIELLKRRFPSKAKQIEKVSPDSFMNDRQSEMFDEDQNRGHLESGGTAADRFKSDSLTVLEEMWLRDYTLEEIPEDLTEAEVAKESMELQQGINPDITKYEDHERHMVGHEEQKMIIASQVLGIPPEAITEANIEELKQDEEIGLIFQIIDDHIEMHKTLLEQSPESNGKRPKFSDNLRLVMRVGQTILFDGPNPVEDGMVPLVPFYCYKDEESIYGIGEVENLIPLQKSLNDMDWAEYEGLRLVSNPGWVFDEQSGVDETTLTNEPGIVIPKKQGTEVTRLQPGQVSPQLGARRENDIQSIQDIAGINEAVLGTAPNDISGVAVERLQQQAIGRIRLKSRNLEEYSIPRRDKLILSRIMKYYSTERSLRIYDNNGQLQFINFNPEDIQDLKYEVRVSPGSVAGFDKKSIHAIATQLLQAGIIDARTFIEMTDVPHRGTILKKLDENDETQAQLQQLTEENLMLKMQLAPETLTEEEIVMIQELGLAQ